MIVNQEILIPVGNDCDTSLSLSSSSSSSKQNFHRDCHAICDINIIDPYDCVHKIDFHLNDMAINVPKGENGWEIKNWFTIENVLPLCILPYIEDSLKIEFNENTKNEEEIKEVRITYKKIVYDEQTLNEIIQTNAKEDIYITYGHFRLFFCEGLVGYVGHKDILLKVPERYHITSTGIKENSSV